MTTLNQGSVATLQILVSQYGKAGTAKILGKSARQIGRYLSGENSTANVDLAILTVQRTRTFRRLKPRVAKSEKQRAKPAPKRQKRSIEQPTGHIRQIWHRDTGAFVPSRITEFFVAEGNPFFVDDNNQTVNPYYTELLTNIWHAFPIASAHCLYIVKFAQYFGQEQTWMKQKTPVFNTRDADLELQYRDKGAKDFFVNGERQQVREHTRQSLQRGIGESSPVFFIRRIADDVRRMLHRGIKHKGPIQLNVVDLTKKPFPTVKPKSAAQRKREKRMGK
jgi:hypothetical protein